MSPVFFPSSIYVNWSDIQYLIKLIKVIKIRLKICFLLEFMSYVFLYLHKLYWYRRSLFLSGLLAFQVYGCSVSVAESRMQLVTGYGQSGWSRKYKWAGIS